MKLIYLILIAYFLALPSYSQHDEDVAAASNNAQLHIDKTGGDSSARSIRIVNGSSLRRLPAVVKDLSKAISSSVFVKDGLLGKNGFAVYLYDVTCPSFENAAAIHYELNDTVYHLKLNQFNRQAKDLALAATLIHEIMHCVLLDIYKRAKLQDQKAIDCISTFGLNKNDTTSYLNNEFFRLVNSGDKGQHELIYKLFYPQMVALLRQFAKIHRQNFLTPNDAESLSWSGLQKTSAYESLTDDEKKDIESAILKANGVRVEE